MAAKRLLIIVIFLAAVVTVAALRYAGNLRSREMRIDDHKFVRAYVDLSVARQLYEFNPDSLRAISDRIFRENDVDSAWMEQHLEKIKGDPDRFENTWKSIVETLDSLKKNPVPDSMRLF